jgi:PAS domain S-box-containing protein
VPDDAVLERTCALDPASLSAREARRFVRALLEESGRQEWAEAAELAVSEVVTNVVLHAHTGFELTVRLADDHVRVEVLDRNPALPRQRGYDDQATTGRGMTLVESVTDAHGVHALGSDGKVVWFCVGGGPGDPTADDLLAGWSDDDGWDVVADSSTPRDETLVDVVLRGMPPALWLAARQHHDAVLRELALHRAEHPDTEVSDDDLVQADAARTAISSALESTLSRTGPQDQDLPLRQPAGADGPLPRTVDVTVCVPPDAAPMFGRLQDVLYAAERLAADDALLLRPALPEVVAVRDWACEQVVTQLGGGQASAWSGVDDDRFVTLPVERLGIDSGLAPTGVGEADTGAVAADDANRIVAVSRPLAEALGYEVDDLVGRRVVTLIPPRFREAHVVGFTRHQSTGEARLLGREVELPVLRRDGTELRCRVTIEQAAARGTRRLYVAWISPLG